MARQWSWSPKQATIKGAEPEPAQCAASRLFLPQTELYVTPPRAWQQSRSDGNLSYAPQSERHASNIQQRPTCLLGSLLQLSDRTVQSTSAYAPALRL